MERSLERARTFLDLHARLLDRLRFRVLFEGASPEPLVTAIAAYQNADGGFGHALEPDLRGPESEPIPVWTALWLLDEAGALNRARAAPVLGYLSSITPPTGGVPFVLREASKRPHAPWWETGRGRPPGALNPTAGISAVLHKNRIGGRWLSHADRWCWGAIDRLSEVNPYELRTVLSFLDHVPERSRAERALERLRPMILGGDVVELDPDSAKDAFHPLDYAPEPGLLSRRLFDGPAIEADLDRVKRGQKADGGWDVAFPIWTPITRLEWRGIQTVEMLKVLRSNGRIPSH
jgi:hypothetical protein